MDVRQEGEGITDVTTHLVDLVQWTCFPEQPIDYHHDIRLLAAKRWPTRINLSEFKSLTRLDRFPDDLQPALVNDTVLNVFCNGAIQYTVRGVRARVEVDWNYRSGNAGGDSFYSQLQGTRSRLVIRQGEPERYVPTLYIEPIHDDVNFTDALTTWLRTIQKKYPGIAANKVAGYWQLVIPDHYREGHEAHFARVTENYLEYVTNGTMPAWEVPNMLTKYYITTEALKLAREK